MHLSRRQAAALLLLPLVGACAQTPEKEEFKPSVGQAGKDVIWVPTPDAVVDRMLELAQVRAGERVVDLGSGDGKIAIAAAKRGAIARGIEYNPDMVQLSRRNARAAGVNVDFQQGDIFVSNFTDADVITLYLLPSLNEKLRPILLNMKPGTRVTSHEFGMGDWQPDRTDDVSGRRAHLWIVPARVAGTWTVRSGSEPPLQVQLDQQFQRLQGHAMVGGQQVPLQAAAVRGTAVTFAVPQGGGVLRFEGTARDHNGPLQGDVVLPGGARRPFTATRA